MACDALPGKGDSDFTGRAVYSHFSPTHPVLADCWLCVVLAEQFNTDLDQGTVRSEGKEAH